MSAQHLDRIYVISLRASALKTTHKIDTAAQRRSLHKLRWSKSLGSHLHRVLLEGLGVCRGYVCAKEKPLSKRAVLGVDESAEIENGTDLAHLFSQTTLETNLLTAFGNSQHFAEVCQFDRTGDSTHKITVRVIDVHDGIAEVRPRFSDQVLGLEKLLHLGRNSVVRGRVNDDSDEGHENLQLKISSGML